MLELTSLALMLAVGAPVTVPRALDSDTTIRVERGARLRVRTFGGDITVTAWDRNELRVRADHSRRTRVVIERSGSVIDVGGRGEMGTPAVIDFELTVPQWMALELGGMNADVRIDGVRAPVRVETLQGDIHLNGGDESISLVTTNGEIEVRGATGRLDLRAVSGDVHVQDARGDVSAESVSGDVELVGVDARTVEAQSVSGEVTLIGSLVDGGTYSLYSHSGDIRLGIPERSSALIRLTSASGEIWLGIEGQAERSGRRRQTVRLGRGSASVDLETFSGSVRVDTPDRLQRRVRDDDRDDDRDRERRDQRRDRRPPSDHDGHNWEAR